MKSKNLTIWANNSPETERKEDDDETKEKKSRRKEVENGRTELSICMNFK